ncbi:MAG: hypothetical protein K2Q26_07215 [Bdellovibrionales bacterium]|nr:hypothetical protein [Bdellovibrionales bacterium]
MQTPVLESLDKTPQFVSTKRIIYFRDARAVELFIEHVGPHFLDAVMVSGDGVYPVDPVLKSKVEATLLTDPKAMIIVFNSDFLSRQKVATDRILALDSIMMNSYRYFTPYQEYRIDLAAGQIARMILNFFEQWDILEVPHKYNLNFSTVKTYLPPPESDWRFEMLGLSPRRKLGHNSDMAMFETVFYRIKGYLRERPDFQEHEQLSIVEHEFASDFDYNRDRFFALMHMKIIKGTVCVKVIGSELLLRCLYFEPEFDQKENYQETIAALIRAFPTSKSFVLKAPSSRESLYTSIGFRGERDSASGVAQFRRSL